MSSLQKKHPLHRAVRRNIVRRNEKRTIVNGFVGDVADGNFVFAGRVEDISSGGVKISHLPLDFSLGKHKSYRTVISGDGKHYRVLVSPCWGKRDEATNTLEAGFKLIDAPWEWEELILDARLRPVLNGKKEYHA